MSRNPCPLCLSKVVDENGRCAMEGQCVPRFNRTLGQKCCKMRRRGKSREEIEVFASRKKEEFNTRVGALGEYRPELSLEYFPYVEGADNDNQS